MNPGLSGKKGDVSWQNSAIVRELNDLWQPIHLFS